MSNLIDNIKKLFLEKRFNELVKLVEDKIDRSKQTSKFINIYAISKIFSLGIDTKNLVFVIKEFENSFNLKPLNEDSISAFIYFTNYSLNLFKVENDKDIKIFCIDNFKKSINFFKKNESLLNRNKKILLLMIRIFTEFSDIKKIIYFFEKIIENKQDNPLNHCAYIQSNSYINNWDQTKFYENSVLINNKIKSIPKDYLVALNLKKNNKIRIAFLSSDLRLNHSVNYFIKSILQNYDKEKFEIVLFLNMPSELEDETTSELKQLVNQNHNINKLNDIDAINLIRNNKIDILVDIMGYTSSNRLALFKNKLAPIQVNWLGYTNTTGLKEMDYIIADPNLILPDEEKLYSENIIYLDKIWNAHCGFNFPRIKTIAPFKKNNHFTFGSFNNFTKINDEVVETWSKILINNKNSKLLLKSSAADFNEYLLNKFKTFNISNSVKFIPRTKTFEDHINYYNQIDIALDTFPYNGVTTSFEAIWMGVPVLTMKGFNFTSRCGESINKNLGYEQLIANDIQDYISKAKLLISNKDKLLKLRDDIFEKAINTPLFDKVSFAKSFYSNLEQVYKKKFL